jgi:hypothetical protein
MMRQTILNRLPHCAAFLLLAAGCATGGGDASEPAAKPRPFFAVAWQFREMNSSLPWSPSDYPFLTHMYWLTQNDLDDGRSGRNPEANLRAAALRLKEATDQMPEGRRVAFDWDNNRLLYTHPEDRIEVPGGEPFVLWWDHGAKQVADRMDRFFGIYKDLGGKLDLFILDFEHGVGGCGVGGGQEAISLAVPERVGAVAKTERFQNVMKELAVTDPAYFHAREHYPNARWLAWARETTRDYLRQAYYEPIRKHFPNVKMSNYGDFCDDFLTAAPNGVPPDAGEEARGRHGGYVGTHQATDGLYGHMGGIAESWAKPMEGGIPERTPFNAMQLHANLMRTTVLSDPAPVTPWIAWRRYVWDPAMPGNTPVGNTDYYQELLYHIALCNPDYFIFWSAFRWKPDMKAEDHCMKPDLQFVNDLLAEINEVMGYADRKTLVDRMVPWYRGYYLSGLRAKGRNLWRLTPDLSVVKSIESCRVSDDPPTFEIAGRRIVFPKGRIVRLERPMSANGFWIETPEGIRPVETELTPPAP